MVGCDVRKDGQTAMNRPLKTSWTYHEGGATVASLLKYLKRTADILPGDELLRTDLQLNVADYLEGYDVERAETAIRQARTK